MRNSESPRVVTITPATRRRVRIAAKPSSGRIAATGGIFAARRDGTMTESMVIPMPTNAAMTIVRGRSTVWASGNPAPAASNSAISPRATSSPPTTPSTVAIDTESERLECDHPAHLAARGADGAEQREFAKTLADGDLEHVVDDECAHEGRDEREHQESGPEDADEFVDRVGGLLGRLLAGDHFGLRWENLGDGALDRGHVGTVDQLDVDRIDLAVGAEVDERGVEVERGELGAAEAVAAAEADRRRDRSLERADIGEVRDRVADLEALGVRGGLVDGDLVGSLRRSTLLDGHALESVLALPRHAEGRPAGCGRWRCRRRR